MQQTDRLKQMSNRELLELYQEEKTIEIRQELTMRYLYLVKAIAAQMYSAFAGKIQMEEIINEGVIAVMRGIDRYDISRHNKFETYIAMRLRGMIIDMIYKNRYLPREFKKKGMAVENARNELAASLGRTPSDEEVAQHIHIDVGKLRKIQDKMNLMNVLSLDMVTEESESGWSVQLASQDTSKQPEEHYLDGEASRVLAQAVEKLEKKEKTVISLYYVENLNMREIAAVMNVSQSRISQLHSAAIRKLKTYMEEYYNT